MSALSGGRQRLYLIPADSRQRPPAVRGVGDVPAAQVGLADVVAPYGRYDWPEPYRLPAGSMKFLMRSQSMLLRRVIRAGTVDSQYATQARRALELSLAAGPAFSGLDTVFDQFGDQYQPELQDRQVAINEYTRAHELRSADPATLDRLLTSTRSLLGALASATHREITRPDTRYRVGTRDRLVPLLQGPPDRSGPTVDGLDALVTFLGATPPPARSPISPGARADPTMQAAVTGAIQAYETVTAAERTGPPSADLSGAQHSVHPSGWSR